MSLINSRGLVFPSTHRESAERSTSVSSCDEPVTPPASLDRMSSPSSSLFPDSSHLSVSLLYPDTAPRSAWRPQIDAWMRRNHPSDLKRISTMADASSRSAPYKVPSSRSAVLSPPLDHEPFSSQASPSTSPAAAKSSLSRASIMPAVSPVGATQHTRAPPSPQYTPLFVETPHMNSELPPAMITSPIPPPVRPLANAMDFASTGLPMSENKMALPVLPTVVSAQQPQEQYSKPHAVPRALLSPPASPPMPSDVQKTCISCSCSQSPCWRPSWSPTAGQLCNSCGLRYKKTGARCVNASCGKIPSKGEWNHMIRGASTDAYGNTVYSCLQCHGPVALRS